MYEIRIFDGEGKLKKVIPAKEAAEMFIKKREEEEKSVSKFVKNKDRNKIKI